MYNILHSYLLNILNNLVTSATNELKLKEEELGNVGEIIKYTQ